MNQLLDFNLLEFAVHSMDIGLAEWKLATAWICSPQFRCLHGLEAVPEVTYDDFINAVHPLDRQKVRFAFERNFAEGFESISLDYRVINRVGLTWIRLDGKYSGNSIQLVAQEITHLRKLESALIQNEQRWNFWLGYTHEAIVILNEDGCICQVTDAFQQIAACRLDPAAILGRSIDEFIHQDDMHDLANAIEGTNGESGHLCVRLSNGYRGWRNAEITWQISEQDICLGIRIASRP